MRTQPNDLRALALILALAAAPAAAQAPAAASAPAPVASAAAALPAGDVYRREVFRYQRGGRPDPFQPLLTAAELGFRVEDLRLTSIIYSPDARRSIAVFAEGDSARRYRLHSGQKLGTMTVLRIWPQRVDVRVDEFGSTRLQTILLQRVQRQAQAAEPPAATAPQAAAAPQAAGQDQQQQVQRVLRRGAAAAVNAAARQSPAPAPATQQRPVNPSSPNYTSRPRP